MPIIYLPYHLDEHLAALDLPLPAGIEATEPVVELPREDVWARLAGLYEAVARVVEEEARSGTVATVVSGDCTISIGMAAGLQRAGIDPAIVWFDAHGDLQTLETTTSGYLGGMALRLLGGYRSDLIAGPLGLSPPAEDRVVLVDARDLDQAEADYLASSAVRRLALGEVSEETLPAGPLLVNFDLDIVDPAELPGLRYPAAGGPAPAALLRAAETVFATGRVAALNVACTWDPGHPEADEVRRELIAGALAALRAGGA
ncbi:arginase family protein [Spongiactinospora sp. TRM90649]|uniref:arginase family protein n=1 Tax=Spongiactinospora sp. TRM90649 TaxID=3031114 RepID=UPI0023F7F77D|nr:arginase family protein [Spongiactinospora sp. TRM90649]MDF5754827.1 arginase family protein [Spongiactinospora sp. TRM90649]